MARDTGKNVSTTRNARNLLKYLHVAFISIVSETPLPEGHYSSVHLNQQFEIYPGEIGNSSQCLLRDRVTFTTPSTELWEKLAPKMLKNALGWMLLSQKELFCLYSPGLNNEGFFFFIYMGWHYILIVFVASLHDNYHLQ